MRECLLGAARAGLFRPIWSERILEEWRRAASRHGDAIAQSAGVEVALVKANWPEASVFTPPRNDLWLPDENDVHVLATALAAKADVIITLNLRDFPTRVLSQHGVLRRDPDGFLSDALDEDHGELREILVAIHRRAEEISGQDIAPKQLWKKARLPKLAKRF